MICIFTLQWALQITQLGSAPKVHVLFSLETVIPRGLSMGQGNPCLLHVVPTALHHTHLCKSHSLHWEPTLSDKQVLSVSNPNILKTVKTPSLSHGLGKSSYSRGQSTISFLKGKKRESLIISWSVSMSLSHSSSLHQRIHP